MKSLARGLAAEDGVGCPGMRRTREEFDLKKIMAKQSHTLPPSIMYGAEAGRGTNMCVCVYYCFSAGHSLCTSSTFRRLASTYQISLKNQWLAVIWVDSGPFDGHPASLLQGARMDCICNYISNSALDEMS